MRPIKTLREWIGGLLGGSEEADADEEADEETAESEPEEPDDDRLDPAAVTETRSAATDDAVDKLRSVREGASATETGSDDGSVGGDGSTREDDSTRADDASTGAVDGNDPTDPAADDGKR
ncbi:hypothetical protein ACFPM1_10230 [Halorubrum rubrum]|uniref:Signal recognition particle-docking protein FtsY n=1 Tax=Halorubrum rubrum TaxID=1126240 RepID=A0ABD5R2N6_9EURY|nr:hypothetical protein [Halorubrum rubrum]